LVSFRQLAKSRSNGQHNLRRICLEFGAASKISALKEGLSVSEIPNGSAGRIQAGTKHLIEVDDGLQSFVLPNDSRPQPLLEIAQRPTPLFRM
jgi:hypothetical protein